ncbi:MAG: response regulator [Alphaproteobacteria bacterium]
MSLLETYAPFLPYLRRFSRALTGSQADGDRYVRTALEALVAGGVSIDGDYAPKVALYRMFLGIWNSSGAELETPDDTIEKPSDRIKQLAPLSRQAFLLNALEGIPQDDIGDIMNISADSVAALLQEAEDDIAKQLRTDVMIIEDEPIIAADIEGLVEDLGHKVTGIAATHSSAVILAKDKKPGLILADVQLADGSSGIDAVDDILKQFDVPVIFITAFPERLLTGDKPEPAYLISKPFQSNNVKAAISQALFFHGMK